MGFKSEDLDCQDRTCRYAVLSLAVLGSDIMLINSVDVLHNDPALARFVKLVCEMAAEYVRHPVCSTLHIVPYGACTHTFTYLKDGAEIETRHRTKRISIATIPSVPDTNGNVLGYQNYATNWPSST